MLEYIIGGKAKVVSYKIRDDPITIRKIGADNQEDFIDADLTQYLFPFHHVVHIAQKPDIHQQTQCRWEWFPCHIA